MRCEAQINILYALDVLVANNSTILTKNRTTQFCGINESSQNQTKQNLPNRELGLMAFHLRLVLE